MATLAGALIEKLIINGVSSSAKGRFVTWPGVIAFTAPGRETLDPLVSSDIDPQLKEDPAQLNPKVLKLISKREGRAVIRIEPSQFPVRKDTT